MARYSTVSSTTGTVGAASNASVSYAVGSDYLNIYKIKIVPSTGAGGTSEVQVYKEAAQTTLVYTSGEFTGTWYDPVNSDDGVLTEGEEGYICPYEDEDAGSELHVKFINNDSVSKTYTITVIYDTYASSGTSTFDAGVIVDVTTTEALNVRKDGDTGDILIVDTTLEQIRLGGQLLVSDTGPHVIGGTNVDYVQTYLTGAFTSGGASNYTAKVLIDGTLTGLTGDTTSASTLYVKPIITTQSNSETVVIAAGLRIDTPVVTKGTDTITNTATLYIQGADTAGANNYALWIDSGVTRIDGNLTTFGTSSFSGAVSLDSGTTLTLAAYDNDAGIGPNLIINRNNDGVTPAAGVITMYDSAGTLYYIHVSADGKLRIGTTAPISTADTTNAIVGTQS